MLGGQVGEKKNGSAALSRLGLEQFVGHGAAGGADLADLAFPFEFFQIARGGGVGDAK